MKPGPGEAGVVLVPPTELSMDLGVEVVITVLLGILALSAPPVLSLALFRGLMKDGFPFDNQKFRLNGLLFSLIWLVIFLPAFIGILFGENAAIPDRLRAASITFAVILILVLSWLFLMFVLGSNLWAKRPDFTKASPHHFFYLAYIFISCAALFVYHFRKYFERGVWGDNSSGGSGSLADRGGVLVTLIPPTELATVLLGILALSVPSVLSLVLFRVLVKEGVPLDSQKFRHNHCVLSLLVWPMMLFPGLFAILYGGTALIPDRLRAASITCTGSLILVLCWFFSVLILRSKLLVKLPDFTKAFPHHFFYLFHFLSGSWAVLVSWGVWASWVALALP